MLIESTEQFQASTGIAIQRGPNEVPESGVQWLWSAARVLNCCVRGTLYHFA